MDPDKSPAELPGASFRHGIRWLIWTAAALWTGLCLALFLGNYAKPQTPSPQLTAEAGAACVLILGGFVIAYALDALTGR